MTQLPFSQACENNKEVILDVLRNAFAASTQVLEIASGTAQHACHFAAAMPWLRWQPTELAEHLSVTRPRCALYEGHNLLEPRALDVREAVWGVSVPDAVFSANSLHIMAFSAVEQLFEALGRVAAFGTTLAIFGPFNYGGRYTSDSNARFDEWLAARDPTSAIRDFEAVDVLAREAGFSLQADNAMPANNRLLVWSKTA